MLNFIEYIYFVLLFLLLMEIYFILFYFCITLFWD